MIIATVFPIANNKKQTKQNPVPLTNEENASHMQWNLPPVRTWGLEMMIYVKP